MLCMLATLSLPLPLHLHLHLLEDRVVSSIH